MSMGQLLVRDLDDEVIRRIKKRASAHGRSVEAEHRAILEEAVRRPTEPPIEAARRFVAELRPSAADSADIIRKIRDERAQRRF